MDERKKGSNKLLTIAGMIAGTCVAAGAAFFVVDSGLAFLNTRMEQTDDIEKESETNAKQENRVSETEIVAKSEDSFTVSRAKETNAKETNANQSETGNANGGSSAGENTGSGDGSYGIQGGDGSSGSNSYGDDDNSGNYNGGTSYENSDNGTGTADSTTDGSSSWEDGSTDVNGGNNSGYESDQNPDQTGTEAPDNGGNTEVPDDNGSDNPSTEPPQTEAPGQEEYIFHDIDKREISEEELYNLTAEEVAAARNEIFARHGRIFSDKKWSDYFYSKSWYVPKYSKEQFDSMDLFNSFEKANLKVILAYESKLS